MIDGSLHGTQLLRIRRIGRKGMWLRRPLRGLRHNAFSSGLPVAHRGSGEVIRKRVSKANEMVMDAVTKYGDSLPQRS